MLAKRKVISDKAAILTMLPVQQKHLKTAEADGFRVGSVREAFSFPGKSC